jgi:hypothetical protein
VTSKLLACQLAVMDKQVAIVLMLFSLCHASFAAALDFTIVRPSYRASIDPVSPQQLPRSSLGIADMRRLKDRPPIFFLLVSQTCPC